MSEEKAKQKTVAETLAVSLAAENATAQHLILTITGVGLSDDRLWLASPYTPAETVVNELGVTGTQRENLLTALNHTHRQYARERGEGADNRFPSRVAESMTAMARSHEDERNERTKIIREAARESREVATRNQGRSSDGWRPVSDEHEVEMLKLPAESAWLAGPYVNPAVAAVAVAEIFPDAGIQPIVLETRLRLAHEQYEQNRRDIINPYRVSSAAIVNSAANSRGHDYSVSVILDTDTARWAPLVPTDLDATALETFARNTRANIVNALEVGNFSPRIISESDGRQHVVCTMPADRSDRLDATRTIRGIVEGAIRSDVSALVPLPPPLAPEINAELRDLARDYREGERLRQLEETTAVRTLISEELGIELPDVREFPHWMGDKASARAIVGALRLDLPPEDAERANISDAAIEKLQTELNETRERFRQTRHEAHASLQRESAHVKEHGPRRPSSTPDR